MDARVRKQIEDARALGAKIQFVLEPENGGLSTLHSYAELFQAPVGDSIIGYVQVYDAHDPTRLVTEFMKDPDGAGLTAPLVQEAADRAVARFKSAS